MVKKSSFNSLSLKVLFFTILLISVLGFVFSNHVSSPDAVNVDVGQPFRYNITINNSAIADAGNITLVNIAIPSTFSYKYSYTGTDNGTNTNSTVRNTTVNIFWFNYTHGIINNTVNGSFFWFNASATVAGTYYVNMTTTMTNGTNYTTGITVNVNDVPAIALISPANGAILTSERVTFVFNVTDSAAAACNLSLNNKPINTHVAGSVNRTAGVNNSFTNITYVVNNTWNITCVDAYGNTRNSSTYNFVIPSFTFSGITYDVDGNALNKTNISIVIKSMITWSQVAVQSTISNESGGFNFSVFSNSSFGYQISTLHTNLSTGAVDYVGQSLPLLPYSQVAAIGNMKFYMQEAGTFNITVINDSNDVSGGKEWTTGFAVQIKDTKLGYPVSCSGMSGSNYLCYVPKNRNYSVMIYPSQGSTARFVPISFSFGTGAYNFSAVTNYSLTDALGQNISLYNHTTFTVNKKFNVTQSLAWAVGYINSTKDSMLYWNNFTVVPFLMEGSNMVFMDYGILPFNASSWRGNDYSDIYTSAGFYNITIPYAPAETTNYILLVVAKNNSIDYASYRNLSISGTTSYTGVNFTMYGMLGTGSSINMTNSSGGTFVVNTSRIMFNLVNTSNSTLGSAAAHIELKLNYSGYNLTLPTFTFMTDLNGQGDAVFSLPLLNISGIQEANIYSQTYAPKRISKMTKAEIVANANFTLKSFNPGAIDGSIASSSIVISLYKSNSTCDVPNPPSTCLLTASSTMATFNPIQAVMGGGKISFRMGTSSGILIHYVNVDMLASGPPDALFENDAGASESSGSFANAMRFGSQGPSIYDYVLISMPYSEAVGSGLDDSQAVTMSIPILYDDNWNIIWNTATNGTNMTSLSNNFSHYAEKSGEWLNLTSSNTCRTQNITLSAAINASYPCYIDNSSNRIWVRLPHFSGTGPSVSGTSVAAAAAASSSGGGSAYTNENDLSKGYTKKYYAGDATTFKISGKLHTFIMLYIKNSTATVQISSAIQKATLAIGEEKKFDVDNNSYYDFSVKLNSISGIQADITLKSINESISSTSGGTAGTQTGANAGTTQETETGEVAYEQAKVTMTAITWIIIAVIVVIIIALIIWYFVRRK